MSFSPSFNSYSNNNLTDIAARVVQEFSSEESYEEFGFQNDSDDSDNEEFEFPYLENDVFQYTSPVPADQVFHNGMIRPVYPVFNQALLLEHIQTPNMDTSKGSKIRLPLRKLFNEERESELTTSSSDSSDELLGVPEETYCVWMPNESEKRCKKSSSTGFSSKRWKFRNLLYRSHSDGSKGSFVF